MLPRRTTLWTKMLRALSRPRPQSHDAAILHLESLECRLVPSINYYVSPSGNDNNNGRSPTAAWQTLDKVSGFTFAPGDTINFQGGATFYGSLQGIQGGTPSQPITYTSYNGRATISSGSGNAIVAYNMGNFVVSNLNLVGEGAGVGQSWGFQDYNTVPVSHLYFENLDVSGYGMAGISIYGTATSLVQDVQILGCSVHDNGVRGNTGGSGGILIQGDDIPSLRVVSGVVIDHVAVWNNTQQFGIYLANVSGGVVERSEVHDIASTAATLGVTAWASDSIVFQNNESYNNYDPSLSDGDGFVFGNGVSNSIMQYNYSHDNSGLGFNLVADLPGHPSAFGNTVRYNISENDSWANPYGASLVVAGDVWYSEIYNNTIFLTGDGSGSRNDVLIFNWTGQGLHIRNNVFGIAPGNGFVFANTSSFATGNDLVFQGNAYFSTDGSFRVGYLDTSFSDLSDWQNATGQEMLGATPTGFVGDPQLINPGQGGTIGNPDLLFTLTAYNLQPTSPVGQAGLDLRGLFGIDPGTEDFYGNSLSQGAGFAIGADQLFTDLPAKRQSRNVSADRIATIRYAEDSQRAVADLVSLDLALEHKRLSIDGLDAPGTAEPLGSSGAVRAE